MKKTRFFLMVVLLLFAAMAFAQGGKQRYALGSEQVVDEVNQLCQQLGIDSGTIEVSTCPPPGSETETCVVTVVDCSLDEED